MNDPIDLAIIGGGPAGTAAALEARRHGLEVALWDRDVFPRDKVCGEVLSAEALPILEQEVPTSLRRARVIRSAEFISPRGRTRRFTLPAPGAGLSRSVMDEALWRAATASGVHTLQGEAVGGIGRTASQLWAIDSGTGDPQHSRFLIVACGRWWTLRGLPSPTDRGRPQSSPDRDESTNWLGVKAHFKSLEQRDAVEMYFFPGGYCGVAPIEDGLYNACSLVHRSLARDACGRSPADFAAWIRQVARHQALDNRLSSGTQVSMTVTTAGMRLGSQSDMRNGALAAGDAGGFIDPFTGSGMSMALNSGRLAASILARTALHPDAASFEPELQYRRKRHAATARSYAFARLIRLLVSARADVQEAVACLLPLLGPRLTAETRWKA